MAALCAGLRMTAHGRRCHEHLGPSSESLQRRKARAVEHPAQRALWGFGWERRLQRALPGAARAVARRVTLADDGRKERLDWGS